MAKIYTINNKILTVNNKWGEMYVAPTPPGPTFDEVTIGTQTWMAKNLDVDDGDTGITIVDNVTANGVNFGTQYYYTWAAATRIANSIDGWHLPTLDEWNTLISYAGGSSVAGGKLKSTSGWDDGGNGTDDYDLNVLPVGIVSNSTQGFEGIAGRFYTSTQGPEGYDVARGVYFNTGDSTSDTWVSLSSNRLSIRLIKDT